MRFPSENDLNGVFSPRAQELGPGRHVGSPRGSVPVHPERPVRVDSLALGCLLRGLSGLRNRRKPVTQPLHEPLLAWRAARFRAILPTPSKVAGRPALGAGLLPGRPARAPPPAIRVAGPESQTGLRGGWLFGPPPRSRRPSHQRARSVQGFSRRTFSFSIAWSCSISSLSLGRPAILLIRIRSGIEAIRTVVFESLT